jgi:N-acetylmuramoyl-L-alanine amidase
MKQSRLLFLSAGHSNTPGRDQGAPGLVETEGVITARIRMKLANYIRGKGYIVYIDGDNTVTNQTVAYVRSLSLPKDAIVMDIHCNSFHKPEATGVEVVIPEKYSITEFDVAHRLLTVVSKALKLPKRRVIREGQSARKKLLWMTIPAETILLELGFISNPVDNAHIAKYEDVLVQMLGDELIDIIK